MKGDQGTSPHTNPSQQHPPARGPWSQSTMNWRQRFGYFFIGAAISLVLIGFWVSFRAKYREQLRADQEARQAGQPRPVPGVPLNPPK